MSRAGAGHGCDPWAGRHDDAGWSPALQGFFDEVGSFEPFPRTAAAVRSLTADDPLLVSTDLPYAPPAAVRDNITRLLAGELVSGATLGQMCHGTADSLFPALRDRI